jgi:hypothetical protein
MRRYVGGNMSVAGKWVPAPENAPAGIFQRWWNHAVPAHVAGQHRLDRVCSMTVQGGGKRRGAMRGSWAHSAGGEERLPGGARWGRPCGVEAGRLFALPAAIRTDRAVTCEREVWRGRLYPVISHRQD